MQLRRELKAQLVALEKAIGQKMRQIPALKPYAKQPYLAYITWAALALPLLFLLLPFLLLGGETAISL